jgi:hypothetical protein
MKRSKKKRLRREEERLALDTVMRLQPVFDARVDSLREFGKKFPVLTGLSGGGWSTRFGWDGRGEGLRPMFLQPRPV